jgi:hypothetical protein
MPAVRADAWDQKTVFTFSAPVEVPGQVLPFGSAGRPGLRDFHRQNILNAVRCHPTNVSGFTIISALRQLRNLASATIARRNEAVFRCRVVLRSWNKASCFRRNRFSATRATREEKNNRMNVSNSVFDRNLCAFQPFVPSFCGGQGYTGSSDKTLARVRARSCSGRWDERAGLQGRALRFPVSALKVQEKETSVEKNNRSAMKTAADGGQWTAGIDLGDRWSHYWIGNSQGDTIESGKTKMTPESLSAHYFPASRPMRIALETGTHSNWVRTHLESLGHEVIVANARELRAITGSDRKSDPEDGASGPRTATWTWSE